MALFKPLYGVTPAPTIVIPQEIIRRKLKLLKRYRGKARRVRLYGRKTRFKGG